MSARPGPRAPPAAAPATCTTGSGNTTRSSSSASALTGRWRLLWRRQAKYDFLVYLNPNFDTLFTVEQQLRGCEARGLHHSEAALPGQLQHGHGAGEFPNAEHARAAGDQSGRGSWSRDRILLSHWLQTSAGQDNDTQQRPNICNEDRIVNIATVST